MQINTTTLNKLLDKYMYIQNFKGAILWAMARMMLVGCIDRLSKEELKERQ
jgi:hypothetical protein